MTSLQDVWAFLQPLKRVAISLHVKPDGDSLGACVAMKRVLEQRGAGVTVVSPDPIEEVLQNHALSKEVRYGVDLGDLDLSQFDAVLMLDTAELKRISYKAQSIPVPVLCIDHHSTGDYLPLIKYVDTSAPSTCAIIYELLVANNVAIDRAIATPLLLGVCTDSGFFTSTRSAERSFAAATALMHAGADYVNDILRPIHLQQPLKLIKYTALVLSHLQFDEARNIAYSVVPYQELQPLGLNMAEVRKALRSFRAVAGYAVKFVIIECEHEIYGAIDSDTKPVHLIAKALGGGGHESRAAFNIPKRPLTGVLADVFAAYDASN